MANTQARDPDDLQRSYVKLAESGRIALAARKAEKARWQAPYPVVNLEPRDRRTREYRAWVARQLPDTLPT